MSNLLFSEKKTTTCPFQGWKLVSGQHHFFSFSIKSRVDEKQNSLPNKLYTTSKYEITLEYAPPSLFNLSSVILASVQVVNSSNLNEEITKGEEKIFTGIEGIVPLTRTINGTYETTNKIQFTSNSYHHKKMYFAMKISFSLPNKTDSITTYISSPFQVAARRPTTTVKSLPTKRKSEEELIHLPKKQALDEIMIHLERVSELKKQLNEKEMKVVSERITKDFNLQNPVETENIDLIDQWFSGFDQPFETL